MEINRLEETELCIRVWREPQRIGHLRVAGKFPTWRAQAVNEPHCSEYVAVGYEIEEAVSELVKAVLKMRKLEVIRGPRV